MAIYRIITYDVLRDEEGGFEVNDAHYTSHRISLPDDAPNKMIWQGLRLIGYLTDTKLKNLEVEGEDGYSIYLRDDSIGKPLLELRCES